MPLRECCTHALRKLMVLGISTVAAGAYMCEEGARPLELVVICILAWLPTDSLAALARQRSFH